MDSFASGLSIPFYYYRKVFFFFIDKLFLQSPNWDHSGQNSCHFCPHLWTNLSGVPRDLTEENETKFSRKWEIGSVVIGALERTLD